MSYKTTREIKSLARGGVSLGVGASCTPQAFTDTLWAKLIKEGAIVEVAPPVVEKPKPVTKKRTRKPRQKKAVANAKVD